MEVPGASARDQEGARFAAIVDLLLTVGYVDGRLHQREQAFVHQYVDSVLLQLERVASSASERARVHGAWRAHFDALYRRLEVEIAALAQDGDVSPRLRRRALERFGGLSRSEQVVALELVHGLVHADGTVTPAEHDLEAALASHFAGDAVVAHRPTRVGAEASRTRPLTVEAPVWKVLAALSHPVLDPLEQTLSPHPVERQAQIEWDYQLVQRAIGQWHRQRTEGLGRLTGVTDIGQLPTGARFLDGHVHVMRPDQPVELIVLGDLHGCYSCLKAAVLQSDFIQRAWAHQWEPTRYPDVKLVLLGDYIDRGRFSFDGVVRAALQLFVSLPDQVILLRGNHEYLTRYDDRIVSGVYPAEALASIAPYVPLAMLEGYQLLFEHMPTSLLCERTMFVHGGIPREDTFEARFRDLSSLNDPELRYQMMWSDPAAVDHVPVDVQRRNPRFPFGRDQFRTFMERAGMRVMVRGHEQIDAGCEVFYDLGPQLLINLFSAGGHDNLDLPVDSSYRSVRPMALTIQCKPGETPTATPWPLHYQPFNHEPHNGLYRRQPLLEFRYAY